VLSHYLKNKLKRYRKEIRGAYIRLRYPFTREELEASLRKLGMAPGDTVLVHSSFDQFGGFRGTAKDVILALQAVVGMQGTLLMPTLPFTGTAVAYAALGKVFDVYKTSSSMGLISELFRRSPQVVRSVHPTHSVAVWGVHAADIIRDHYLARTPCGHDTPFDRLLQLKGKMLFLGMGIEVMTFFHTIEEQLEPLMPFSPFTKETFCLRSKDQEGRILETKTRLFDPEISRRRNLRKLTPILKSCDAWREGQIGYLKMILLQAEDVAAACLSMAEGGKYCYDF